VCGGGGVMGQSGKGLAACFVLELGGDVGGDKAGLSVCARGVGE